MQGPGADTAISQGQGETSTANRPSSYDPAADDTRQMDKAWKAKSKAREASTHEVRKVA